MSYTGTENLDASDITTATVVLVQAMSNIKGVEDLRPGTFVDMNTLEVLGNSVQVVPLSIGKYRALMWDRKTDPDKKGVRCRSNDCITPDVEHPVSPSCVGCEQAFKDLRYKMLCLDIKRTKDLGIPVVFDVTFKGLGTNAAKRFISAVLSRKKMPREFSFALASERSEKIPGIHVMTIGDVRPIEKDGTLSQDIELAVDTYCQAKEASTTRADQPDVIEDDIPF